MKPATLCSMVVLLASGCAASRPAVAPVAPAVPAPPPAPEAAAEVPPPLATGRLPPLARPTRMALELRVDPGAERFEGVARIEVAVPAPTRVVVLHARGLTIARVEAVAGGERVAGEARERMAAGGRELPEELVLVFPRALPAGAATLELRYTAAWGTGLRGLYRVRVGADAYAFTDFEPTDARRAFPCFDEPGFKVPVDLTVTVPAGSVAVANMNELERREDPATRATTFRFATTPPTSSYLVAFAVGPFDFHTYGGASGVPIRVVTTRGRAALGALAAEAAAAHLRILGDYFDRPYPYPKLDLVAVPDFGPGAMENPGLVTFREERLLLDPARASTRARHNMAGILAHELAHQWFGDLVTMAWWDDLWLNEGFATWMTYRVLESWQPAWRAQLDAAGDRAWAMEVDGLAHTNAIRQRVESTSQAVESFDAITYGKGAAVLAMLESWLGEDTFRAGVRSYVREHAWGTATAADLLAALTRAAGREVSPVAETFLDQPGVPVLRVETACAPGARPRVTLTQRRFSLAGDRGDTTLWRIPVCLRHDAGAAPAVQCLVLAERTATVELSGARCPRWVYPNAHQTGYYRYELPAPAYHTLLTTPGALDDAGRIDVLTDVRALTHAGVLGADVYLQVLEDLRGARELHLVEGIASALWDVERSLVGDANRADFRAFVARVLGPLGRELGWSPAANERDERRNMRRSVLGTLGFLTDDPWVRGEAERLAQRWLADPGSVDPDIAGVALPVASRPAGAQRFDALVGALERATAPQDRVLLLGALASFDDLALARRALDLVFAESFRLGDVRNLVGRGAHTAGHRSMQVAWVRDGFERLRVRLSGHMQGMVALVGGLCTARERAEAEGFFGPRVGALEGAERPYRRALESVDLCVGFRARDEARATAYLARRRGRPAAR